MKSLYDDYALPEYDGAVTVYVNLEASASGNFKAGSPAIFVNGMKNAKTDHRQSAVELSLLLMRPIHGLFNESSGAFKDLLQCAMDKFQFDGPAALSAKNDLALGKGLISLLRSQNAVSEGASDDDIMRAILSRNPATLALFDLLRSSEHRNSPIYAHSQGNLILSNALSAVAAVDGNQAIAGREVHSFGSPSMNWPRGLNHQEYAFTGDPVALLAGFDFSFKISKLGIHSHDKNFRKLDEDGNKMPPEMSKTWLSHGFLIYMQNDPAFVVNRFRWGGWGVTFNMDERGLAEGLLSMGNNMARVQRVLLYLNRNHNLDADDVAQYYTDLLRAKPQNYPGVLGALKMNPAMRALLIRLMDEGWTTSGEKKSIAWLEGLSAGS